MLKLLFARNPQKLIKTNKLDRTGDQRDDSEKYRFRIAYTNSAALSTSTFIARWNEGCQSS